MVILFGAASPAGGSTADDIQNVLDELQQRGYYSKLLSLLQVTDLKSGLIPYISGKRATMLAPTDMAIEELSRVGLTMDALISHPARTKDLLLAHIFRGDARCSGNLMNDKPNRTYTSLACDGDVEIEKVTYSTEGFKLDAKKLVFLSVLGGQPTVMNHFDDISTPHLVVHGVRLFMVPGRLLPCWGLDGNTTTMREVFGLPAWNAGLKKRSGTSKSSKPGATRPGRARNPSPKAKPKMKPAAPKVRPKAKPVSKAPRPGSKAANAGLGGKAQQGGRKGVAQQPGGMAELEKAAAVKWNG